MFIISSESHCSQYHNYIDVCTDDSKANNLIGSGIVCRNIVLSYRLPAIFSIFFAEFIAIELALKLISSYSHKHFIIYTDSRSVLEMLQSNSYSPSFTSVLQLYNELCNKGFCIFFVGFQHMWILKATKVLIKQLNMRVTL